MRYITSAYYDAGIRTVNEDSLLVEELYIRGRSVVLGVVADGVGGLSEGEVASGYLVENMMRLLFMDIKRMVIKRRSLSFIKRAIVRRIYEVYEDMCKYAHLKEIRMGTTLSMMFILGQRYILVHIGDSAVFRCRKGRMIRLTPVHHNEDGSLSKCIGSIVFQRPYVHTGWIKNNTGFLLCTDGYYKKLDTESGVFRPKDFTDDTAIEKRLVEVGRLVSKKGETDNKAAIYIKSVR